MAKEYLLSSVHVHTKLCDGKNTPEELALSAWKAAALLIMRLDAVRPFSRLFKGYL